MRAHTAVKAIWYLTSHIATARVVRLTFFFGDCAVYQSDSAMPRYHSVHKMITTQSGGAPARQNRWGIEPHPFKNSKRHQDKQVQTFHLGQGRT